jgi:Leucine-rich repeat (LRR) protein
MVRGSVSCRAHLTPPEVEGPELATGIRARVGGPRGGEDPGRGLRGRSGLRIRSRAWGALLLWDGGSQLRTLDLQSNRIASPPDAIGNLRRLTSLDSRFSLLSSLPETMAGLERLRFLDLRANRLQSLPPAILELEDLEKLDLRWNRLPARPSGREELERRGCTVYV